MKTIPLTQGKVALIDDEDFDLVSKYKWCAFKARGTWYAVTSVNGKNVRMHMLIKPTCRMLDHVDRDGLNNRKHNLRECSHSQNAANRPPQNGRHFKGAYRSGKKWLAKVQHNGKAINIGFFDNEEEAAKAYDAEASKRFGEFAYLNFPQQALGEQSPTTHV